MGKYYCRREGGTAWEVGATGDGDVAWEDMARGPCLCRQELARLRHRRAGKLQDRAVGKGMGDPPRPLVAVSPHI